MSTNSKLRQIANQLPPMTKLKDDGTMITYTDKRKIKGADLIKAGTTEIELEEGKKEAIKENQWYLQTFEIPYMRNKFSNLKEIIKKHGEDGVNEYINLCFTYNQLPNPGIKF